MSFIFCQLSRKHELGSSAEMIYISQYTSVKDKCQSCLITSLILLSEGRNHIAQSRIWTQDRLATKPTSYHWAMRLSEILFLFQCSFHVSILYNLIQLVSCNNCVAFSNIVKMCTKIDLFSLEVTCISPCLHCSILEEKYVPVRNMLHYLCIRRKFLLIFIITVFSLANLRQCFTTKDRLMDLI